MRDLRTDVADEMPETAHHKVMLPALCWGRDHHDFYAVTNDISRDGIHFRSAIVPSVDERLTCNIRHIGPLETRIVRTNVNAFVVKLATGRQRSKAVAEILMDVARKQGPALEQHRLHPRLVPRRADIVITLEDGSEMSSRLLNISASGAAIHLDQPLEVGMRIRVGNTRASVVRSFPHGAGIAFLAPFDPAEVNEDLVL